MYLHIAPTAVCRYVHGSVPLFNHFQSSQSHPILIGTSTQIKLRSPLSLFSHNHKRYSIYSYLHLSFTPVGPIPGANFIFLLKFALVSAVHSFIFTVVLF